MTATWGYGERIPRNGSRDGAYIFVASEGERAVNFFERRLWIAEGDFAGQRYKVPGWQDYALRALYGWRRRAVTISTPGALVRAPQRLPRRYRRALIFIPRGNLKSALASGVALKAMTAEGIRVPTVVGAGTDRKNAAIVFSYSAFSARKDPGLASRLDVFDGTKVIKLKEPRTGNYVVIAASDEHSHGGHPVVEIVDDLQAQPRPSLLKVLRTAQITLSDSLFLAMMTAGFEKSGPGWDEYQLALEIERDPSLDPEYLACLYRAEEDDDIEDPAVQRKANPSLGVSIRPEELLAAVRRASAKPAERAEVLTLHFNIWVDAETASFIAPEKWDANLAAVPELQLRGRRCFAGLVATSSVDIASVVYLFPPETEPGPYDVVLDAFVPQDRVTQLQEQSRRSYVPWIDAGWLTPTPGDVIDEGAIVRSITRRRDSGFAIQEIATNPRGAVSLQRQLGEDGEGFTVVAVTPGRNSMSPAMRELERLVLARGLRHGGDALLGWQMANLRAKRSAEGDVWPDGERSKNNITGSLALLLALSRHLAAPEPVQHWGVLA